MDVVKTLSVLASLFNAVCLILYYRQLRKGQSIPNPATWLIWIVFTIMNFVSYFLVTDKNVWISSLSLVNSIGNLLLFFYILSRRKFAKLGNLELLCLGMALIIGIYWKISGNAIGANISLQSILVISYLPTYAGLWTGTLREHSFSWTLTTIGYALLTIAVGIDSSHTSRYALFFPLVNVALNAVIVCLVIWRKPGQARALFH